MNKRLVINFLAAIVIAIGGVGLGFAAPIMTSQLLSKCSGGGHECTCKPGQACTGSGTGCSCDGY